MNARQLDTGEQAFVVAFAGTRRFDVAVKAAKFPPAEALDAGCRLLGRIEVRQAILAQMPECRDRDDLAANWDLELDGKCIPKATLQARAQVDREALVKKMAEHPLGRRPRPPHRSKYEV
ncbi:hypothetical protein [Rhodopila sp.]|uniref:hypothetical protein n=1 Tax=Rhodopila sp. TaxID=2480087 RepID=UPI003D0CCBDD